jgi:hypothetical protein
LPNWFMRIIFQLFGQRNQAFDIKKGKNWLIKFYSVIVWYSTIFF